MRTPVAMPPLPAARAHPRAGPGDDDDDDETPIGDPDDDDEGGDDDEEDEEDDTLWAGRPRGVR